MNNPNCRNKEELNKDKQALQVDFPSSQFVRICVHAILRILQIWTSANSTNVSKDKTIIMAFLHGLFSDEKVPFLCLQSANFTWHSDSERRLCWICCFLHFSPSHLINFQTADSLFLTLECSPNAPIQLVDTTSDSFRRLQF